MDIKTLNLHPDFPEKVWVAIEQPRNEPYRFSYNPLNNTFIRTTRKSLIYERGFSGVYGWLGGLGTPPEPHYDILLLTTQNPQAGDIVLGYICGVFYRSDGDHKFVALDTNFKSTVAKADLVALDKAQYDELMRLYPRIDTGEGWYGASEAQKFLMENKPSHD